MLYTLTLIYMICAVYVDVGVQHVTRDQTELVSLKLRKLSRITAHAFDLVRSTVLNKVDLRGCLIGSDGT